MVIFMALTKLHVGLGRVQHGGTRSKPARNFKSGQEVAKQEIFEIPFWL
jgi:hypothetical protein